MKIFFLFFLVSAFSSYAHSALFGEEIEWQKHTTDKGCIVNLSYKNFFESSYSWSGECEAGKGITGKGQLKQQSQGGDCSIFSGEMTNGYWISSVPRIIYNSSCSGRVYDSRTFNFPKPEDSKLITNVPASAARAKPAPSAGSGCVKVQQAREQGNFAFPKLVLETVNNCNEPQLVYIKFERTDGFPMSVNSASWWPTLRGNPAWGGAVATPEFPWPWDHNDNQLQIFAIDANTTARAEINVRGKVEEVLWNPPLHCDAGGTERLAWQRMFVSVDGKRALCATLPRRQ